MAFGGIHVGTAAHRSCTSGHALARAGVKLSVLLGVLGSTSLAAAQTVCLPGTTVCAAADGHGNVRLDANGKAQATPNGASASGQTNANGSGQANANGAVNAGGAGSGGGSGTGYSGGASRSRYRGRFGVGVTLCPIARVGIWSGLKGGGCVAVSLRFEALTVEMESQLLYGGTTHAFDWTFPISFLIPLANQDSLFQGPYLRFGASPIGATFAHAKDGGNFVRFGLFAGAGYELEIGDGLYWRAFDARLSFDMGTRRAMDERGHWGDLGLQLGTGLVL